MICDRQKGPNMQKYAIKKFHNQNYYFINQTVSSLKRYHTIDQNKHAEAYKSALYSWGIRKKTNEKTDRTDVLQPYA